MTVDTITKVQCTLVFMKACSETLFPDDKDRIEEAVAILEDLLVKEVAR